MKNILFLMIAALVIAGCSKEGKELTDSIISDDSLNKFLSKDSIHYYITNNDLLVKKRRSDATVVWERSVPKPKSISINIGYGEYKDAVFSEYGIPVFDTEDLIIVMHKSESDVYALSFSLYSNSGDFINNINITYPNYLHTFMRWNNDFILIYAKSDYSGKGYYKFNNKGEITESKDNVNIESCKDPIIISDKEYITYQGYMLYLCDFDNGTREVDLFNAIKSKYPNETTPPKVNIRKVEVSNKVLTIYVSIILYSGKKEESIIKVNNETGEIEG